MGKGKTKKSAAQLEIGSEAWKQARRDDLSLSSKERSEDRVKDLDEKLPPPVVRPGKPDRF
jgi:hypothetical protein